MKGFLTYTLKYRKFFLRYYNCFINKLLVNSKFERYLYASDICSIFFPMSFLSVLFFTSIIYKQTYFYFGFFTRFQCKRLIFQRTMVPSKNSSRHHDAKNRAHHAFLALCLETFQNEYFTKIKSVIFYRGNIKENLKQVGALYQAALARPTSTLFSSLLWESATPALEKFSE